MIHYRTLFEELVNDQRPRTHNSGPSQSNAQNRNRNGANDPVAVGPEVSAIRVTAGNEQIRICLLRGLAEDLWHITTADEYIGFNASVLL